jgi:hypothetical protein
MLRGAFREDHLGLFDDTETMLRAKRRMHGGARLYFEGIRASNEASDALHWPGLFVADAAMDLRDAQRALDALRGKRVPASERKTAQDRVKGATTFLDGTLKRLEARLGAFDVALLTRNRAIFRKWAHERLAARASGGGA